MSELPSSRNINIVLLTDPPIIHRDNTSLSLTQKKLNLLANTAQKYAQFQSASIIYAEIANRLIDYLKITFEIQSVPVPKKILDLSSRSGVLTQALAKTFPDTLIVSFDLSDNLLRRNLSQFIYPSPQNIFPVSGLLTALPFQEQSFDLIISHGQSDCFLDSKNFLLTLKNLLTPQGLLLLSTFGPKTLHNIQAHWESILPNYQFIPNWPTVSEIGDQLKSLLFTNPVISQENLFLQYQSLQQALADLKILKSYWDHPKRYLGLTTPRQLQNFFELNSLSEWKFKFELELIYACASK